PRDDVYAGEGAPGPVLQMLAEVLFEAVPDDAAREPLLKELRRRGVFVVPLRGDESGRARPIADHLTALVLRARDLEPEHIVLLSERTHSAALAALRRAGLPVVEARVPAPGEAPAAAVRRALR